MRELRQCDDDWGGDIGWWWSRCCDVMWCYVVLCGVGAFQMFSPGNGEGRHTASHLILRREEEEEVRGRERGRGRRLR